VLPEVLEGPAGTVILVDKPKTWTSFAVCARLRSLFKIKKVATQGPLTLWHRDSWWFAWGKQPNSQTPTKQ